MSERILSCKDLTEKYPVSRRTIKRMEAAGKMPPRVYITQRCFGYRESEVAAIWEAPGKQPARFGWPDMARHAPKD